MQLRNIKPEMGAGVLKDGVSAWKGEKCARGPNFRIHMVSWVDGGSGQAPHSLDRHFSIDPMKRLDCDLCHKQALTAPVDGGTLTYDTREIKKQIGFQTCKVIHQAVFFCARKTKTQLTLREHLLWMGTPESGPTGASTPVMADGRENGDNCFMSWGYYRLVQLPL